MGIATVTTVHNQGEKKKLIRRSNADGPQGIRRIVQLAFLALNGWLGL